MPHNAALVFNAVDPCEVCDEPNFLTVFILDPKLPSYTGRAGVKMNGGLVAAEKCMNCGTWARATVKRAGATRVRQPIREAVVQSLKMRVRIH